jgi:hypothetical protein
VNCGDSGFGLQNLAGWLALGRGRWAVVHFNFGIHDIKRPSGRFFGRGRNNTSQSAYRKNLRQIVRLLKRGVGGEAAPQLVWCRCVDLVFKVSYGNVLYMGKSGHFTLKWPNFP